MTIAPTTARPLGTMVACGFPDLDLRGDLAIAGRLGASVVELFPDWRSFPDPRPIRTMTADAGLFVHSAHGCWGGQSIHAPRVDLGSVDPSTHAASLDDLRRCIDWLDDAGGTCLVIHPGGLSGPEQTKARRDALASGLLALADHALGTPVVLCVENMPPGVHPGSKMADIARLVAEIDRPEVALALDTGHARITSTPREETLAADRLLRTTHVHDNDGRQDSHLIPGHGVIDWDAWAASLDAINYRGPIMLECIRHLRRHPEAITPDFLNRLRRMTGDS